MSGVKLYTNLAFGIAKSVLFIEVYTFQGVLIRGVPLYTCMGERYGNGKNYT